MAQNTRYSLEFDLLKQLALVLQEVNFLHHSLISFSEEHPSSTYMKESHPTCLVEEFPDDKVKKI